MPVKWTPDNDQILLLKILETHPTMSVDVHLVSAAWPEDREKPSPRAITERLVKIRKSAGATFSVGSAQTSAHSTPRKPRAPAAKKIISNGGTPTTAGEKRKRGSTATTKTESMDVDDEFCDVKVAPRELQGLNSTVTNASQIQYIGSDSDDPVQHQSNFNGNGATRVQDGTPSKKSKFSNPAASFASSSQTNSFAAGSQPFPIFYQEEGDDDDAEGEYEDLDLSAADDNDGVLGGGGGGGGSGASGYANYDDYATNPHNGYEGEISV